MFSRWYRNRFVWVAIILAMTAGAVALVNTVGSGTESDTASDTGSDTGSVTAPEALPGDLPGQIKARMRSTLEQADPEQHNHGTHNAQQGAEQPAVVCGVHVYGFEPAGAAALADVRTVYGFHLCGVAEQKRPWDVAVKLAGPVILDMSVEPAGIQVVEATAEVMYIDRLKQMFPAQYAELAQKEALSGPEMADLRRRYDAAAGL